jgi:hypothetical protein
MLILIHYVIRVTFSGFCIFGSQGMEFTGCLACMISSLAVHFSMSTNALSILLPIDPWLLSTPVGAVQYA